MKIVYLNGQYLPIEEAKVSVLDRGFLFSDSVYEVISVFQGKIFRCQEHLYRLEKSLNAIYLTAPLSIKEFEEIFHELLKRNHIKNQNASIYLQITRGSDTKRDAEFPKIPLKPTIFVMLKELERPDYSHVTKGFSVITTEDIRWAYPHIKTTLLLPNILALEKARNKGAYEALLIRDGCVIEGTSCNFFMIKDGVIIAPPSDIHMLNGITRDLILEIATMHHIPYQERKIKLEELSQADEIWLTSSSRDVIPITKVDGHIINHEKPGPLWEKMLAYIYEYRADL